MSLCTLGMAEEFRDDGIAFNSLWPRTLVATAAVQNLLGGDEAMAKRARTPGDLRRRRLRGPHRPSRECTGNFFLCEDVLVEEGVTDFDAYAAAPGRRAPGRPLRGRGQPAGSAEPSALRRGVAAACQSPWRSSVAALAVDAVVEHDHHQMIAEERSSPLASAGISSASGISARQTTAGDQPALRERVDVAPAEGDHARAGRWRRRRASAKAGTIFSGSSVWPIVFFIGRARRGRSRRPSRKWM